MKVIQEQHDRQDSFAMVSQYTVTVWDGDVLCGDALAKYENEDWIISQYGCGIDLGNIVGLKQAVVWLINSREMRRMRMNANYVIQVRPK